MDVIKLHHYILGGVIMENVTPDFYFQSSLKKIGFPELHVSIHRDMVTKMCEETLRFVPQVIAPDKVIITDKCTGKDHTIHTTQDFMSLITKISVHMLDIEGIHMLLQRGIPASNFFMIAGSVRSMSLGRVQFVCSPSDPYRQMLFVMNWGGILDDGVTDVSYIGGNFYKKTIKANKKRKVNRTAMIFTANATSLDKINVQREIVLK